MKNRNVCKSHRVKTEKKDVAGTVLAGSVNGGIFFWP